MEELFKLYKAYWDKAYKNDISSASPIISILEFNRKQISDTPFWSIYCKSFCERKPKLVSDFFQVPEEQKIAFAGPHLFMMNAAPLCRYHSMFLPYFKDKAEQEIIKAEDISLNVELLKASKDPELRVLFNSLKAGASMNHLHFHLIITKELYGETKLPIERCNPGSLISTPLLNIYKQTKDTYAIPHFMIKCTKPLDDKACKAIADTSFKLINAIKEARKAYNLIMGDEGSSLYIVPRNEVSGATLGNGAIECCGIVICLNPDTYNDVDQKVIMKHFEMLAIKDEELNEIESIFLKS